MIYEAVPPCQLNFLLLLVM